MRLVTLNTHSHLEEDYEAKCEIFANYVDIFKPDVIALQEVNQSRDAKPYSSELHIPTKGSVHLKEDNHALKIANILYKNNIKYYFSYLGFKKGYDRFDEGIALMSRKPITLTKSIQLSKTADYDNWKTRMALVAKIGNIYFCSAHLGWWNDGDDSFQNQFENLNNALGVYENIYLMGDLNSPADTKNEGYDLVCSHGWHDTFAVAYQKDNGFTIPGSIAGWNETQGRKRIDYIFMKQSKEVTKSQVLFDGSSQPRVSDHFAVMADINV